MDGERKGCRTSSDHCGSEMVMLLQLVLSSSFTCFAVFQVQDLMFSHDGQELFSCGDVVTKESSDRTILAWDFRTGVVLSNQIFQVTRFL